MSVDTRAADVAADPTPDQPYAGARVPDGRAGAAVEEPAELAGWGAVALHALRRGLAVLRRVASVVRPTGWIAGGAALALWILGPLLGWRELTVAAAALTAIVAACALFLIGRTSYDVELDLTRTRVVVGEKAYGALTLANAGARAILPSRVVLPVGEGRGTFGIRRLAPGERIEELFTIPTNRRAVLPVGPVSIVRGDPLGMFERVEARDESVDLYVHPKTIRFSGQSLGFVRDLEGMTSTVVARDDIAFHALTEYQPGDDLRHVHWRSSARTGTLMMRTYEETRRSHFVVGLSTNVAEYASDDEFELAVSVAGSVGLRAVQDAFTVDLRTQDGSLPATGAKRLLDSLSGVDDTRPKQGDVGDLGLQIAANLPLSSVVVIVSGSRATVPQLREACGRVPHGVRTLAIVAAEGAEPALRRIGEADLVTVGDLEQLPMTLRRVLA